MNGSENHDVPDDELVRRSVAGSEEAMSLLYTRYSDRIIRYVFRMTLDRPAAEDIVHDTFVRFFEGMDRYEPRGQLAAFLFTIARRVMADRLRERARSLPIASPAGTAATRSPDEEMEAAELKERVSGALLQLSDKLREVVVLRIYDGMTYAEISGITGVGESTLQSRLLYALEELRRILRA